MQRTRAILAIFDTHEQAQTCVRGFLRVGVQIPLKSIAAPPSFGERAASLLAFGRGIQSWTQRGLLIGALVGFLIDTALFPVDHIATMDVTGPLASWIVAIIEWSMLLGGGGAIIGTLRMRFRNGPHLIR
jgi:hypothetical protein